MNSKKIRKLTRTALMVALLVALQWATSYTQPFAGQYITGSCVNAVLAVSAVLCNFWGGAAVAVFSPLCAFALGIGPQLLQIVPAIALGNLVYVAVLWLLRKHSRLWQQAAWLIAAAAAKFAVLYLAVVRVLIPVMGSALPAKQAAAFTVMFSWPQLVTALAGGTLALLLLPILRKAVKE